MQRLQPAAIFLVRILGLLLLLSPASAQDGDDAAKARAVIDRLPWVDGPGEGRLGDRASMPFSKEFRFLAGKDAARRLEMSGNRVDEDSVLGLVEHREGKWWIVFEFSDTGYVKDDDKDELDKDKLLESYRRGVDAENERRDGPPTRVVGWHTPPRYNETTHNLEWAIIFEQAGTRFINHNVRVLGRKGIMRVTLVEDMEQLDSTLPKFRDALAAFKYQTGESYAEYRPGDKVAKYGLTALVAGGAALGAAKLGLFAKLGLVFKKFFKVILFAIVALAAGAKRLLSGLFRRRQD